MAFVQRVEKTGPKGGTYHANEVSINMKQDLNGLLKDIFAAASAAQSLGDTGIKVKIDSKEYYAKVVDKTVPKQDGTSFVTKNWMLSEDVEKGKGNTIWINSSKEGRDFTDVEKLFASKKEGYERAYVEVNLWTKNEAVAEALATGKKLKFGAGSITPANPKAKDVDEVKIGAAKQEGPKNDGPDMA